MRLTHTTHIACPPERVWPWLHEEDRQRRWMKGLLTSGTKDGGPPRAGAPFVCTIREGRSPATYEGEYVRWEPPRRLVVTMEGGCTGKAKMRVEYELTPEGGGTRVDYVCSAEMTGFFLRLLGALFGPLARLQMKRFFKTLKECVEAEETVAA